MFITVQAIQAGQSKKHLVPTIKKFRIQRSLCHLWLGNQQSLCSQVPLSSTCEKPVTFENSPRLVASFAKQCLQIGSCQILGGQAKPPKKGGKMGQKYHENSRIHGRPGAAFSDPIAHPKIAIIFPIFSCHRWRVPSAPRP